MEPGTWSDDGAQAFCLLDSLITCGMFDLKDFSDRLLAWYHKGMWAIDGVVFDIGIQTGEALTAYGSGMALEKCGILRPNGKGNGGQKMNPSYFRIKLNMDEAVKRLCAWIGSDYKEKIETNYSKAVDVSLNENGQWKGACLYVYENDDWTVFEDLSGGYGFIEAEEWLKFAKNDEFVLAGYNDAIICAEMIFISKKATIFRKMISKKVTMSRILRTGQMSRHLWTTTNLSTPMKEPYSFFDTLCMLVVPYCILVGNGLKFNIYGVYLIKSR